MRKTNASKELVSNANLNSVLGGGLSIPVVRLEKSTNHIQVSVSMPGVDPKNLRTEIVNNRVVVFRLFVFEIGSDLDYQEEVFTVHTFPISEGVDVENIYVYDEEDELHIILPMEEELGDVGNSDKENSK